MSSGSNADPANGENGHDRQAVELSVEEGLVLRGAINVLRELATRHDLEPKVAIPLNSGRAAVFRRLRSRLNNRIQGPVSSADTIEEVLDPAEAQAARDAAGVLSTLLRDAGGREILAGVGFLPAPDAAVDEAEVALLDDIADRIEPTGVRTGADATGRAASELINPNRPLEEIIATAAAEITHAELPWPGFEQATFSLRDTQDAAPELDCDQLLNTFVATVKLVVGATRLPAPDDRRALADDAEATLGAVMDAIEDDACLSSMAVETVDGDAARLVDSLREAGDTIDSAQDLLAHLQDVAPLPTEQDPGAMTGTQPRSRPPAHDDPHRQRLEQLREETGAVIGRSRAQGVDDVGAQIDAVLPSSTADCGGRLVALAELGQLMAQVVAADDPAAPAGGATAAGAVDDARRTVMGQLARRGCLPDDDLRALRDGFYSIGDPLPDDPDDVETRAFAFLSDVREAFLEHGHEDEGD